MTQPIGGTTTIRFQRPLLDQLNRSKVTLGMSRNAIVNEAVEFWLDSQAKTHEGA
ncbi:hypothetical protein LEP3755_48260 [Leptolyngbya sp. NIES-3755]|nr:hypothetical protein LEP3755_48260 [Leptolyngbya sp. NIES-3755]